MQASRLTSEMRPSAEDPVVPPLDHWQLSVQKTAVLTCACGPLLSPASRGRI